MQARKHEWVRWRMEEWVRWLLQSDDAGLGYPKRVPFARELVQSTGYGTNWVPTNAIQARAVDVVVKGLRVERVELWLVVQCHYVGNPESTVRVQLRKPMSWREIAQRTAHTERWAQAALVEGLELIGLQLQHANSA